MSRPTTYDILAVLAEAGEPGLTGGEITGKFTEPAGRGPRQRNINETLKRQQRLGRTRKSEHTEPSAIYNRVPVYRWFITAAGQEFLARGRQPEGKVLREQHREQLRREYQENLARRRAIIQAAIDAGFGRGTPQCQREAKIREMRAQKLTLEEIGTVFDLTRERVRQIEMGRKVGPCRCAEHAPPGTQLKFDFGILNPREFAFLAETRSGGTS